MNLRLTRGNQCGIVISVLGIALSCSIGSGAIYVAPQVTLEQILKAVRWNPEQQGPLMIIDPAHTKPISGNDSAPAAERTSLRVLARSFNRKIVPLGSLTVLAPTTMVVIGPPLRPPISAGAMEGLDPLRYLLATLKPDQWQGITSDNGLPISALSPTQLVWLNRIIPATPTLYTADFLALRKRTLTEAERDQSRLRLSRDLLVSLMGKDGAPGNRRTFRGSALNPGTSTAPVYTMAVDIEEDTEKQTPTKKRKPILRRVIPSVEKLGDIDLSPTGSNNALLSRLVSLKPDLEGGLTLGTLVKRASKATALEIYADGRVAPLPIWVNAGSRTTVRAGDLLRALCQGVTGTLRRVGPPSGKGAYVLTEDREGIGSRIARIVEWERASSVLADDAESKAQEKIEAANVGKQVKYAPNDPFALDTALMLDVMSRDDAKYGRGPYIKQKNQGDDLSLSLEQLPASFRQFVEAEVKKVAADTGSPEELRNDRVGIEPTLYLALLLPDGNTVRAQEVMEGEALNNALTPEDKKTKPEIEGINNDNVAPLLVSLSKILKPTSLAASAASTDEARSLVQEARRYGFAQIWLQTPPTQSGLEALTAAVTEGRAKPEENAISVWGVAPLLREENRGVEPSSAAETSLDFFKYDRNVLGDTSSLLARRRAAALDSENGFTRDALRFLVSRHSDFLRFDKPVLAMARMRPLLAMSVVPGLAGIAISDTAPPGYGLFHEKFDDWYTALQDSGDFGYNPEMRLAFLRQEGYDPIDLSLTGTEKFWNGSANLPFFPTPEVPIHTVYAPQPDGSTLPNLKGSPVERWSAFRKGRNEQFLGQLYQKLRESAPHMPLMLAEQSGGVSRNPAFWGSWDAADKLPCDREMTADSGMTSRKNPHLVSMIVYSAMTVPPDDSFAKITDYAANFPFVIGAVTNLDGNNSVRSEGLLIDLRTLSREKTEQFLRLTLRPQ